MLYIVFLTAFVKYFIEEELKLVTFSYFVLQGEKRRPRCDRVRPHLSTTAPDHRLPVADAVSNIGHSSQKRLQPLGTAKLHCMHIITEFCTIDYPLPSS